MFLFPMTREAVAVWVHALRFSGTQMPVTEILGAASALGVCSVQEQAQRGWAALNVTR